MNPDNVLCGRWSDVASAFEGTRNNDDKEGDWRRRKALSSPSPVRCGKESGCVSSSLNNLHAKAVVSLYFKSGSLQGLPLAVLGAKGLLSTRSAAEPRKRSPLKFAKSRDSRRSDWGPFSDGRRPVQAFSGWMRIVKGFESMTSETEKEFAC